MPIADTTINRTISGIETEYNAVMLRNWELSIAPSLELKRIAGAAQTAVIAAINRTISGIETDYVAGFEAKFLDYQSHHLWN